MKYRILKFLLFASAFAWGISAVGLFLPWEKASAALTGLGAGHIPEEPMLDYWLRMTAGAYTGVGAFFLLLAFNPPRYSNIVGTAGILMFAEGLILLVAGIRLDLAPFPFYSDTAFCLIAGAGIWYLRNEAKERAGRIVQPFGLM